MTPLKYHTTSKDPRVLNECWSLGDHKPFTSPSTSPSALSILNFLTSVPCTPLLVCHSLPYIQQLPSEQQYCPLAFILYHLTAAKCPAVLYCLPVAAC
jgi:hypothetical protein